MANTLAIANSIQTNRMIIYIFLEENFMRRHLQDDSEFEANNENN